VATDVTNNPATRRFPPWLKKRLPAATGEMEHVRDVLAELRLATVCQSAHCPNLHECFHAGTATFLIMGDSCTRSCRFCAVHKSAPRPLDAGEPERVAEAAAQLKLRHVVITSVTRDDLADGGADHFRRTIIAVREKLNATIEVLTPDFQGVADAIDCVASAKPEVYNHNIETVPRLYSRARPKADYRRSLALIARVAEKHHDCLTKSGIMVGLGETAAELRATLLDLRQAGCELLTIGQYLQPSPAHLPVERFVPPEEFEQWKVEAERIGFRLVASGPFVRSSYEAGIMVNQSEKREEK
jgi:lipoyl synthase